MGDLRIRLFGAFEVTSRTCDAAVIKGRRTQELLAYLLLVPGQSRSRDVVAGAVWPDADAETSKKQVRQALWHVHQAVDADRAPDERLIAADGEQLAMNPARSVWCDALAFLDAVDPSPSRSSLSSSSSSTSSPADDRRLETALDLYRGPLLDGCYSEWCLVERERLEGLYLSALDAASLGAEARHDLDAAVHWARAILRVDPAHERSHYRLMRLHQALGDRTRALRQFDRCVTALRDELAVEPSRHTVALANAIRDDDGEPAPDPSGGPSLGTTDSEIVRELAELRRSIDRLQSSLLDRLA